MKNVKDKWKYPTIVILTLIFIEMLLGVLIKKELYIDTFMYDSIILSIRNDTLTKIFTPLTFLASPTFLVIASIIIFFLLKGKKEKKAFAFNICFITLLNQILKHIIVRPRPSVEHLVTQGGYSFPSGHAMVSTAFYGYLIYLLWKTKLNKTYKYIGTVLLIILVILICFSRIYLGVHYASDIIAGVCLSIIHLIIYLGILKRRRDNMWLFKKKEIVEEPPKFIKSKVKRINKSFKYAGEGIFSAFKTELNMQVHLCMMMLVILCGIIFDITLDEWQLCIILFGIVIGAEIFNTAIETVVDLVMPNINEKAKLAKDLSAGAVLVIAISAAVVGLTIFVPKALELFM